MYTFLLNKDKSLLATERIKIYQREKLVDKVQFILPQSYEEIDLTNKNVSIILKYVDQEGNAQSEFLVKDDELYKDNYVRCELPIDTNITKFAGNITLHLTIIYLDVENQINKVMHSSETILTISPLKDMYVNINDKSLEILDQKIIELQASIEAANILNESIDKNKADDLSYEDNTLQLMSNGKKIGTPQTLDQLNEFDIVNFDSDDSPDEKPEKNDNNTILEF